MGMPGSGTAVTAAAETNAPVGPDAGRTVDGALPPGIPPSPDGPPSLEAPGPSETLDGAPGPSLTEAIPRCRTRRSGVAGDSPTSEPVARARPTDPTSRVAGSLVPEGADGADDALASIGEGDAVVGAPAAPTNGGAHDCASWADEPPATDITGTGPDSIERTAGGSLPTEPVPPRTADSAAAEDTLAAAAAASNVPCGALERSTTSGVTSATASTATPDGSSAAAMPGSARAESPERGRAAIEDGSLEPGIVQASSWGDR